MAATPDVIEFTRDQTGRLLARMDELSRSGKGWINIGPGLTPEEFSTLPPRSTLAKFFSGRGAAVPMATWTPGAAGGRGSPTQVGLDHGTGPNALDRLREAGVALPSGWVKRQDHAKHGIVAEIPEAVTHDAVIEWLLPAMVALSPRVRVGVDWIAEVYSG